MRHATKTSNLFASRIGRARVAMTGNISASFGKRHSDGRAESGRRARDQSGLPVQFESVENQTIISMKASLRALLFLCASSVNRRFYFTQRRKEKLKAAKSSDR